MMYYFKFFLLFFITQFSLIFPFFCLFFSYIIQKEIKDQKYSLYTLKYYNNNYEKIMNFFFLIILLITIIFLGLLPRFKNIGSIFDLIFGFLLIEDFFFCNTWYYIFFQIFKLISYIYTFFTLIKLFKKIFFTQFMKIHLFLISRDNINNPQFYLKFINNFNEFSQKLILFPIVFIKNHKIIEKYKIKLLIYPYFFPMLISFILIIYDILFNNFFIQKIFYFLPILYIFFLIITLQKFYRHYDHYSFIISSFYYSQIQSIEEDDIETIIIFYNGYKCSEFQYEFTIDYMMNNFQFNPIWKKS